MLYNQSGSKLISCEFRYWLAKMDVGESDKDISSYTENDGEDSSEEDSEEESDDDADEEEEGGGTDASSGEEADIGTESEEEDEDGGTGCDANHDAGEASSTATAKEALDKGDLSDLGDPDMSCPICLNELAGQDLGSPENCSHTFCFECILEWSKNVNTCPIDRIEFHLIYVKQEINGDITKKVKVKVQKEVEEYVEEVTLCEVCGLGDREDRLLLCDSCDSGYHCECLDPPLETIPIEEWFCPPCAQVLNQRANSSQASYSRLIARTSASEIVRSRIQQHRTANSGDSGSETTQQSHRIRSPSRAPQRRKTTKRKTKRKTTRRSSKSKTKKARTKATATGKSKIKKGSRKAPTKKRKTKRRKTAKKKKKSKKSWLASMKLVAPSVKKRIADHLGLCKPPCGQSMPYVKKSGNQHSSFVEQLPSLNVFGCRDQLFDFSESYTDDDLDNPKPSTSKQSQASASRSSIVAPSTSGINLLDNILEKQNNLLRNSNNITIGKDGSLSINEKNSSVKTKCGIKGFKSEHQNDSLVSEQNQVTLLSSSGYVKKEKDDLATDSPSDDTRKIIPEGTSSSVSTLSCNLKKEKPHLHSRVRFNDTETVFRILNDDVSEETDENFVSAPVEGECNPVCSSLSVQGNEDILPEKVPFCVKKDNDLLLNTVMDTESVNADLQTMTMSFDANRDRHGHTSPSIFDNTFKQSFDSMNDSPNTSTNKLNFLYSTDKHNSIKSMSTDNHEPVHVKMADTSLSLFDKAENDRKRHLSFLSNSLQRPFKIPKLARSTDKTVVSKMKLSSSESTKNCSDTKVLIQSENLDASLISEELASVRETSQTDSKLKNGHWKCAFDDHTDLSEAMDTEFHAGKSNTLGAAPNSFLRASKQEKVSKLYKNYTKNDLNSRSSFHVMPKLSHPENGTRHSSEGRGHSFQKVVSFPSGVNSDFAKFDKKAPNCVSSSSSRGVKSKEHKHMLNVSANEVQSAKPVEKSSTVENAKVNASDKVPSKHKLTEDIVAEIKKHLKDFYVTDLITKDEYKEIMRRSVPKVLQNCGNSIDSAKIRKLVISYVHIIGNSKSESS